MFKAPHTGYRLNGKQIVYEIKLYECHSGRSCQVKSNGFSFHFNPNLHSKYLDVQLVVQLSCHKKILLKHCISFSSKRLFSWVHLILYQVEGTLLKHSTSSLILTFVIGFFRSSIPTLFERNRSRISNDCLLLKEYLLKF
jgi:hypothetical protein